MYQGRSPVGLKPSRGGFTVVELVVVMMLLALAASVGLPRAGEAIRIARVDRAARTVAVDLEEAITMAARQRQTVRVTHPAGSLRIEISNLADGTIYSVTDLDPSGLISFGVEEMTVEPAVVNVFATGQTSSALRVNLIAGERERTITMSPAGQIRVLR